MVQGNANSPPGTLFSATSSTALQSCSGSSQCPFSSAQKALDAGSLDFDTCLQLLLEVLQPASSTYFNFGACPHMADCISSEFVGKPPRCSGDLMALGPPGLSLRREYSLRGGEACVRPT